MRKKRFMQVSITAALTCSLGLTAIPASATTASPSIPSENSAHTESYSDSEIDTLADNLESLFTHGLTLDEDGSVRVNEKQVVDHFGNHTGNEIISQFRAQSPKVEAKGVGVATKASYGECVLNATGFGTIFGASNETIIAHLNKKEWKKAAEKMVKFLGRHAVKGGVVGLAASLAASGAWCATPWGR